MLHGVWVLVFALPFAGLVEQIPIAALAGLLIVIGIQLVKITHIETARRTGDIAVYLVTVVGVVFLNLLEGVLLGLALSILMTMWRVARTRITAEPIVRWPVAGPDRGILHLPVAAPTAPDACHRCRRQRCDPAHGESTSSTTPPASTSTPGDASTRQQAAGFTMSSRAPTTPFRCR